MTVSTSTNSVVYRGNGAATQFAVPFKVLDEDHLVVRRRVFATGAIDYTYVGTDYSYAGIGASSGTLTLADTALDDDYELVIERIVPYTQDLDIVNAGGFYPDTVEEQLDLIVMGVQQVADLAGRGAVVPVGEDGIELPPALDRAGTFFAFDAEGQFVASSGTGNDSALRTDLATATGSSLISFIQPGTGSVSRTIQGRLRDTMSLADKGTTADMLTALQRVAVDLAAGGTCTVPRGTWTLSGTFTFTGDRLVLQGSGGPYGTTISFNPASADVALEFDAGTSGGVAQSEIRGFGFASANSVTKTAIQLVNVADCQMSDIGISTGNWLGDSIGIRCYGRQFVRISRVAIGCARPLVFTQDATHPTISTDYFVLDDCDLVSTSATRPVVEFEDGVAFSNTTIRNVSLVGGKDGIRWVDTTATTVSVNLTIKQCRSEQGLDAAGYAIRLESTAQELQNLLIEDLQAGGDRNGIYLRMCRNITLVNCQFNQTGKTAMDITLMAGGRLEIINCTGAGTFTFTNARCVRRSSTSRALGFSETWVYDANSSSGALQHDTPLGGVPFSVANDGVQSLTDDSFAGFIMVSTSEDVSAIYCLRGGTHTVAEVSDPDNFFTITEDNASTVNIYWKTNAYKLQNKRGATISVSVLRLGTDLGA